MEKRSRKLVQLIVALLAAFLVLYEALWIVTAYYGISAANTTVCSFMQNEWHHKVASWQDLREKAWLPTAYYCNSSAIGPFVISLSAGYQCGPLCGHGDDGWLLWFPGAQGLFVRWGMSWDS